MRREELTAAKLTRLLNMPLPTSTPSASPNPSESAKSIDRLANISAHMAGSNSTVFTTESVPQAPEDPLFGLMSAYRKDSFEKKVDLGIGAYRDNNAKPWVLPVVKKVFSLHVNRTIFPHSSTRPMKSCGTTPTSTTNIYRFLVSPNLPPQHRN